MGGDDAGSPVGGGNLLLLFDAVLGLNNNIGPGLEIDERNRWSSKGSDLSSLVGVAVQVDNAGVGGVIDSDGIEDLEENNIKKKN